MQKIVGDNVRFGNHILARASILAALIFYAGTATGAGPGDQFSAFVDCDADNNSVTIPPSDFDGETQVIVSIDCSPGAEGDLTVLGARNRNFDQIIEAMIAKANSSETDKTRNQDTTYHDVSTRCKHPPKFRSPRNFILI
jgi:hypothetical protein